MFRFLHFALWASNVYHNTVGRFDQYMWPYLKADLDKSVLTPDEAQELLEEFGFRCEDFGPGSLLVREIPADIDAEEAASALEMLAEEIKSCRSTDPRAARDAMLHTIACKAAIKAGMSTSEKELKALVKKVQSGEVKYCPHGRPVEASLTKYQLEKMFRRA